MFVRLSELVVKQQHQYCLIELSSAVSEQRLFCWLPRYVFHEVLDLLRKLVSVRMGQIILRR